MPEAAQLSGLKVLELASVLAGPGVGQFFAELGAEVIKIENILTGGDVTRTWKISGEQTDDRSAYFCSVNWGKRSIAVDLNSTDGQQIAQELAMRSDVVIASYKPGDAEKLKVDYETLSRKNPGLIYGQISGYGSSNARVGYDAIIQAEAGFMFMNGEAGGPSLKMPVALMDILAGHQLKEGLLLAMLQKAVTGKGKLVEVSLIQSAAASLANQATNWLMAKKLPSKKGSAHPNIAPYGDVFKTADDREIILAVGSDQQFKNLCQVLKLNEISNDTRFQTNANRVSNRPALVMILNEAIANMQSSQLFESLNRVKVPVGIINNMSDVMKMPEIGSLILHDKGLFGLKTNVFSHDSENPSHFLPPPHFGEHSIEILSKFLNYSSETVKNLISKKIIA
jgi:crotonobetainyl-CoA:carnitine CoA-transferase CaiB-like acyl-CoA transferase